MGMDTISTTEVNASRRELEAIATDLDTASVELNVAEAAQTVKLESNVGDVGMAPDYSNNQLASALMLEHPLLDWLMQTSMSAVLRRTARSGLAQMYKDQETGEWMLMLPYTVYTLPPASTAGACCWVPFDIAKCAANAPLRLLCLKDCYSLFDKLVNKIRRAGSNDLTNYFLRPGETVQEARVRMARLTMAYMTARNVILGVSDAGTETLKPFHGLLEVMENPAVINIAGGNILQAMASLACRLNVLGGNTNFVMAMHPLIYTALQQVVVRDIYGRVPAGWTISANGDVRFMGIRIIQDKIMPIDLDNGTGDIWLIDGNTTGVFLGTNLMPTRDFINDEFTATDNPDDGCASECTYYWNFGTVANSNPNRLAVITGVPISTNCTESLAGLDNITQPTTPAPFV